MKQNMKCTLIAGVIGLMFGVASQAAAKPLKVFQTNKLKWRV